MIRRDGKLWIEDDEGFEIEVPSRFKVCGRCEGRGTHTNPAIDGNGITADEMDELGDDFREDYMRGVYDVRCEECHGKQLSLVPDWDAMDDDQKDTVDAWVDAGYAMDAEAAAERRMGC